MADFAYGLVQNSNFIITSNTLYEVGRNYRVNTSTFMQVNANVWTQVYAGQLSTYAIQSNGTLWSWGSNSYGQLGVNDQTHRSSPIQIGNLSTWTQLPTGSGLQALAIQSNGTLWSWGGNSWGQLGLNDQTHRSVPVQTLTNNPIVPVAIFKSPGNSIYEAEFVIKSDGSLWATGNNSFGQLGQGDQTHRSSPTQITGQWSRGTYGIGYALGIQTNGTLWGWGNNSYGQLGLNTLNSLSSPVQVGNASNWTQVVADYRHTVALQSNGTAWAWGYDNWGQLGNQTSGASTNQSSPIQFGTLSNWAQISCGYYTTLGIQSNGTLWVCGINNFGELGQGDLTGRSSPTQVGSLSNWAQVAGGWRFNMAIQNNGTLWGWGDNDVGQLGQSNTTNYSSPVQVGVLSSWAQVVAGIRYTLAIQSNGTLWGCGYGSLYNLGDNSYYNVSTLVQVGSLSTWAQVNATDFSAVGIQNNGTFWAWGNNSWGQLGVGDISARSSPVQVILPIPNLTYTNNWTQVSCGYYHTAAIQSPGTLWSWGSNSYGQLAQGNTTNFSYPMQIGVLSNWTQVSCGYYHTIGIQSPGTLWGWGDNGFGQLGNSSTVTTSSPVQFVVPAYVSSMSVNASIGSSYDFQVFLRSNNTLWVCGYGNYGQLGQNNITSYSSPVQIGALSSWSQVAPGTLHCLALQSNGTLWSWGNNSFGQLGQNTSTNYSSPVQVGTNSNWVAIASGGWTSFALQNNGTLWAWGANTQFVLATGDKTNRSSPVQIGSLSSWTKIVAAVSGLHVVGTQSNGTIWGWGANNFGQLGLGDTSTRSSPTQIMTGQSTGWSTISCGYYHTIMINTAGALWAMGNNSYGQLGFGDLTHRSSPVQLTGTWATAAAGAYYTLGATSYATWAWGFNNSGQLGTNNLIGYSSPTFVINTVGTLSAGNDQSSLLTSQGIVYNWGSGSGGGLGRGNTTALSSPSTLTAPTGMANRTNWVRAIAGYRSSMALQSDGSLWVCGANGNGQLGLNTTGSITPPTRVGTLNNWTSTFVLTTGQTAFGMDSSNQLWSIGNNVYGELGNNSTISKSSPVIVSSVQGPWREFAGGQYHAAILQSNGSLWTAGNNSMGQLGYDNISYRSSALQIGSSGSWVGFPSGSQNTWWGAALNSNNNLYVWGNNSTRLLNYNYFVMDTSQTAQTASTNFGATIYQPVPLDPLLSTPIKSVSFGDQFGVYVQSNGTLWSWGNVSYGQTAQLFATVPTPWPFIKNPKQVTSESSGAHFCMITTNGTLWGWGANSQGQLGVGDTLIKSFPVQLGYNLSNWVSVGAGGAHTVAVQSNGTMWSWGINSWGQLGQNDTNSRSTPVQVGFVNNWAYVACGYSFTLATQSNGTLWAWGNNSFGQLGQGNNTHYSNPTQVGALSVWTTAPVARALSGFSAAIQNNGTLWVWGNNSYGLLGQSSQTAITSPVQFGVGQTWNRVAAGAFNIFAIRSDTTLWGAGHGIQGQLGQGNTTSYSSPVQFGTSSGWTAVSMAYFTTYAIQSNGTLWACGYNTNYILGNNSNVAQSSPVQLGTASNWAAVYPGTSAVAAAAQSNGTLWVWGSSGAPFVAMGIAGIHSPLQIGSGSTWAVVGAGLNHTMAIQSNGTLWSWGNNSWGQLGQSNMTHYSSPVQVGSVANWSRVAGGPYHTVALQSNGTLWAWGNNSWGQLGQGDFTHRSSPIQVGTISRYVTVYTMNATILAEVQ